MSRVGLDLRYRQMALILIRMDASRINLAVGAELRAARARHGWSREELAERSGVSPVSIRRYEGGMRSIPVDVLVCLIEVLKIDIADIDRAIQRSGDSAPKAERASTRAGSADQAQSEGAGRLRAHQRRFTDDVKRDQDRANKRA
ncbi:hypothetical protein C1Y40_04158 [Mycobacterium talmoniae]|uniref:HTH cro/C1-type domain-containing protein n=1 Tax=Mycobacterium talmoniae TaxID=1858794 RepID=A0A2S8BGB3_9MYCO|nr:hypothetical protein C1Y40_04158 [Mycobacterium talmoniae]